jgi:hypothetical protein
LLSATPSTPSMHSGFCEPTVLDCAYAVGPHTACPSTTFSLGFAVECKPVLHLLGKQLSHTCQGQPWDSGCRWWGPGPTKATVHISASFWPHFAPPCANPDFPYRLLRCPGHSPSIGKDLRLDLRLSHRECTNVAVWSPSLLTSQIWS